MFTFEKGIFTKEFFTRFRQRFNPNLKLMCHLHALYNTMTGSKERIVYKIVSERPRTRFSR